MRLNALLPVLLALQGMEALDRPSPPQTSGAPGTPGAGSPWKSDAQALTLHEPQPLEFHDAHGFQPGSQHGGSGLGLDGGSGVHGVEGPQGVGEASGVQPAHESSAQAEEMPTTFGAELLEMIAFMRRCVEALERLQAAAKAQTGGGGSGTQPAMNEPAPTGQAPGGTPSGGATAPAQTLPGPAPIQAQQPSALWAQTPPTQGARPEENGTSTPAPTGAAPAPHDAAPATPAVASVSPSPASNSATPAPQTSGESPAGQTQGSAPASAKQDGPPDQHHVLDGGGSYTHHLVNDTGKDMDVAYFKNNGPGPHPGFSGESLKVHLKAGETADVSIPDNWQGRAQKYGGKMDDPATWAEFNNEPADASKGRQEAKTWFDVSKIPGSNANLTMTTGDGVTAGSDQSMLEAARRDPRAANLLTKDAAGNDVFKPAQGFDGKTNKDVVDFFTQYEPEKAQAVTGNAGGKFHNYILPNNDSATRVSQSKEMTLTFRDL